MKDQWLKDIHDRMAELETEEPSGLWEDIERSLDAYVASAGGSNPRNPERNARMLRLKRWSGIAAMVALAIAAYLYLLPDRTGMRLDSVDPAGTSSTPDPAGTSDGSLMPEPARREPAQAITAGMAALSGIGEVKAAVTDENKADGRPLNAEDAVLHHNDGAANEDRTVVLPNDSVPPVKSEIKPASGRQTLMAYASPSRSGSGRFSVSAFTSGGLNSASRTPASSSGSTIVSAIGPDGKRWEDSPVLGILLFNQGKDLDREIKHRLPVRTGLAFSYRVNERLSLESGITYTNLTSDIRYGSDEHYFSGKQTLHYIGVPLNVRYRVMSWGRLDLYASAGVLGEKCVSGKIDRDYVIDCRPVDSGRETVSERRLQWSVNAVAGLQFNLTPAVGIYAEPGVRYYIDNGSAVENIYKDKPCNLDLNVGLRLSFGR